MTRLWIDGTEAVLPETFTIEVKRENPFFTRNGEYTYDITLSLLNSVNATLYGHLNRLNGVKEVKSKRRALLMADNRVYCDGTEVVTGWTERQVTIQVASGNSELNYLIGGSLKIEWLKLLDDVTRAQIAESVSNREKYITSTYPDVNFNLAPFGADGMDYVLNVWRIDVEGSGEPVSWDLFPYTYQPYLCAVIRLLAKAIGYTMNVNQLEDTPYKNLYLVSGRQDNPDWGQLLKGWSVSDFLEQVEKMFNAVFVVNNRTREMNLVLKQQFYSGGNISHVRLVDDAYEAERVDEPDVVDPAVMNIGYDGSSDWWKWMKLDEDLVKSARQEVIPANYPDGNYMRPYNFFLDEAHQRKDTIYTDETNGRQYIFVGEPLGNHDTKWGWENHPIIRYRRVNALADVVRDDDADKLILEFQPAETVWKKELLKNDKTTSYLVAIPKAPHFFNLYAASSTDEETLDIAGQITGEQDASTDKEERMEVVLALYDGLKQIDSVNGVKVMYPMPYIIDTFELPAYIALAYRDSSTHGASLAPKELDAYFCGGGYAIDYHKEVKIKSHDPNVFDPSTVWEVKNKRYVCKEVEYTLDAHGRKGSWTATLYPIRISDTEAESRWILSDGKWRDGGVWIDNGRWIDR